MIICCFLRELIILYRYITNAKITSHIFIGKEVRLTLKHLGLQNPMVQTIFKGGPRIKCPFLSSFKPIPLDL